MNSNSSTLVKVISAVLKFTPQQTQVVLEKENHRHTLVILGLDLVQRNCDFNSYYRSLFFQLGQINKMI